MLINVFLTDETKTELSRHNSRTVYCPKNTIYVVKHGGGSIILWSCVSSAETRDVFKIEGIMISFK